MANTEKTRVDVVTGFLGAGKTTFLQHYARYLAGLGFKLAVVENEFGAAGVDAALLEACDIPVAELSGGCICCALKVDFASALVDYAASYPMILVEPSGIFTPDDFWDVAKSPAVRAVCRVGTIITVVDPGMVRSLTEQEREIFENQCSHAGCIVLSKTDLYPCPVIDAAIAEIRRIAPAVLIVDQPFAELTQKQWAEIHAAHPPVSAYPRVLVDHARMFQSTTLYPQSVWAKAEIEALLDALTDGSCGQVLRVKGALLTDDGTSCLVNAAASTRQVVNAPLQKAMVNIIGKGLDRKRIRQLLEKMQSE